jgi:hypothetical protein
VPVRGGGTAAGTAAVRGRRGGGARRQRAEQRYSPLASSSDNSLCGRILAHQRTYCQRIKQKAEIIYGINNLFLALLTGVAVQQRLVFPRHKEVAEDAEMFELNALIC